MNFRRYLGFMLVVTGLAACGPMSSGTVQDLNIRDWIGHSAAHLIQSWGKPHHDYPTADGGRAIGYMFTNQVVTGPDYLASDRYYKGVTGPRSQVLFQVTNCMINFTVDRNGIIDDATTTGAKCRIVPHGEIHPPASKT